MTLEEKAALVSGHNFMYTNAIPSAGLPPLECSDGPHGLRKQGAGGDNGVEGSLPSTAFPTAATTASGWNRENLKKMGAAIAKECRHYGVDVLLGPAVNIKRNPLCGRNFEYFSEDPYLTAEMGGAMTGGVQSGGVGVTLKHFAANNAENYRNMGNSVVDERALREIYLKAFERIIKKQKPAALMCAYNQINGEYCSEHKWLMGEVLRGEWGFDGIVMTDWGAVNDRVKGVLAGVDLEMPGDTICRDLLIEAVKEGRLSQEALDPLVARMVNFVTTWHKEEKTPCDFEAHHALAVEIAADCAVLMKNDGTLPLKKEKQLIVGHLFEKMRYQGAGSSLINPAKLVSPKSAFDSEGVPYAFARGYTDSKTQPEPQLIHEAVRLAKDYDTVLVFAGQTDLTESEGGDRQSMQLPQNQLALINALIGTGKKIVIVLFGGSPVELPFADDVCAILNMYLPGQGGGEAARRILFGEVCPSGKLAESWPLSYNDVPYGEEFSKKVNELYKESIFVGYRYYTTAGKAVRYPFGYGLSYTSFAYSDLAIEESGDEIVATCTITNTGACGGAEIVQLYTGAPAGAGGFFAERQLRAFDKIYLAAGESKRVTLKFCKDDLKYFDLTKKCYRLAGGEYSVMIGASVEDIRLKTALHVEGEEVAFEKSAYSERKFDKIDDTAFAALLGEALPEEPKDKPITMDTRLDRYQKTYLGRRILKALIAPAARMRKEAQALPDGVEKEQLLKGAMFCERLMMTHSARSLTMSSCGTISYERARGYVELANGNLFEGVELLSHTVKPSKLPADEK